MVSGPSLLERLFYITVRMSGTSEDGDKVSGTAFFYNHRFAGVDHLFLVSNSHVVNELDEGMLTLHSRTGDLPDPQCKVSLKVKDVWKGWLHHPDDIDLAIMPVSFIYDFLRKNRDRTYVQALTTELVPTMKQRRTMIDALEDVYFIGYPNDVHDKVSYLPVVRKGTTATPFSIDFNGKPMFLLDGSIFPGSSGSPVLMIDQNGYINKRNIFVPKRRVFFLGILRSCFTYSEEMPKTKGGKEGQGPLAFYKQMMDLGVVIRSEVLVEMVERYLTDDAEAGIKSGITDRAREILGLI